MGKARKVSSWFNFLADFRVKNPGVKPPDVMSQAGMKLSLEAFFRIIILVHYLADAWRQMSQAQKEKFASVSKNNFGRPPKATPAAPKETKVAAAPKAKK
jgi:hypothetical protein